MFKKEIISKDGIELLDHIKNLENIKISKDKFSQGKLVRLVLYLSYVRY
jgi:hypothetical protein